MFRVLFCLFATQAHAIQLPRALRVELQTIARPHACEFDLRRGARPEIVEYEVVKTRLPKITIRDLVDLDQNPGGAVELRPDALSDEVRGLLKQAELNSHSPRTRLLAESALAFARGETPGTALLLHYHLRGLGQGLYLILPTETYPTGVLVATRVTGVHEYLNSVGVNLEYQGHKAAIVPIVIRTLAD